MRNVCESLFPNPEYTFTTRYPEILCVSISVTVDQDT